MRLFAFIIFWFVTSSVLYINTPRSVFGVNISIGPNSRLTTFVCFIDNGRTLAKRRNMDATTFIKIASGHWPSIYNPTRRNYFEEHNIDCSVYIDSLTHQESIGCVPIDSLWKIRFSNYPFRNHNEMGWSNKYHRPSPGQEKYLYERYNVRQIDGDYFLDTNFWRLMQDVSDSNWVANYRSIQ